MSNTKLTIRQKAEKVVLSEYRKKPNENEVLTLEEMKKIVHELEVHQVELEMQNEELLKTQEELNTTKKRYFNLYDKAPIGYCTLNNGKIDEVNHFASSFFGLAHSKLLGQPITNFIFSEDQDIFYLFHKKLDVLQEQELCELRMRNSHGRIFWVCLRASIEINSENTTTTKLVISDITIRKKYEKELETMAHYDTLTGLPNRALLSDRIEQGMLYAKRHNLFLAIVFLDLDGFKNINDTYGHNVGDKFLISVSKNMNTALRKVDTLARIGGDEFVAVLFDCDRVESSMPIINRLLNCVNEEIVIDNISVQLSASLGVTFYPQADEGINAEQLVRQADQAMYESKISGKNCYHIFNTAQDDLVRSKFDDTKLIEEAIDLNQFVLFYQPKVKFKTGEIIGFEALIRWQHPQKGLLSPSQFLPMVEGNPISIDLGEWVIDTALSQIERLQDNDIHTVISVNVGAMQLLDDYFVKRLKYILSKHPKVKISSLEIEILETSKLKNLVKAEKVIVACNKLGIKFALDDFGTGYSSLTYLKQLPIGTIKIDQSFVRDMLKDASDLSIIEGIINLSDNFNRNVIAEGVETIEHGKILIQLGCEFAQGYAISRPMPEDQIIPWLKSWKVNPTWKHQKVMNKNQYHILYASIEHRSWMEKVISDIKSNKTQEYINNDIDCKFEDFLVKKGKANKKSTYEQIILLHKELHSIIRDLVLLNNNNHHKKALKDIYKLREKSDELVTLLNTLLI